MKIAKWPVIITTTLCGRFNGTIASASAIPGT